MMAMLVTRTCQASNDNCVCFVLVYQCRIVYWKKRVLSDNTILHTLMKLCSENIAALCDLYNLTVQNIVDLPVSWLKDIIWF